MDKLDLDDINYNALYKLHTGHAIYGSDSESSDSTASNSFLDQNQPPLYTYEELEANSVVIEAKNEQHDTGSDVGGLTKALVSDKEKSPLEVKQEKLEELIRPNYYANLPNPNNANSHYNSPRHKNNIREWRDKEKSPLDIKQEKLEQLIHPNYCYLCDADLPNPNNANSHYNSPRHKNNIGEWRDKSIEEILIEEKLTKYISSDYCYLCYADLPQPTNAKSHYGSTRHQNNIYTWKSNEMEKLRATKLANKKEEQVQSIKINAGKSGTPATSIGNGTSTSVVKATVNTFCIVCGINVGSGLQEHYRSDLHKRSVEKFCFLCNVQTMSKEQLHEHVRIKHKDQLKTQGKNKDNLTIPRTIITPVLKKEENSSGKSSIEKTQYTSTKINNGDSFYPAVPKMCSICDIPLGNANVANEHYKSINHQRMVEKSQGITQTSQNAVPLGRCYSDVCNVAKNSTEKAEDHYKEAKDILKNISFYCHICKLKYGSKSEMDYHVNSFPHNEVSKLKSLTVSKGISTQEFWKYNKLEIMCNLCDVFIQSESSAIGHIGSKRHVNNFNSWCSRQVRDTKDPNRRWYFCDVCNERLDGTTYVELHYQGIKHAEQLKKRSCDQQTTAPDKPAKVTIKATRDEDIWNSINIQQEKSHPNIEKPVPKNYDLNTNVANDNIPPSSAKKKRQKNTEKVCDKSKLEIEDTNAADVISSDNGSDSFYCYLCKINFTSRLELNDHVNKYPHTQIAKLKSLAVSKGITEEFWESNRFNIGCSLCHGTLQEESSAYNHFQSSRHLKKFNIWSQAQANDMKDPKRRWYFCDICNVSLDGTTNVELHYRGYSHAQRQKNTLHVTAVSASTDTVKAESWDEEEGCTIIKSQQEKVQTNIENSVTKNDDLNTNVTNNTNSSSNCENKQQQGETEKVCDKSKFQIEVSNMISSGNENKLFFCYLCEIKFTSHIDLNNHVRSYPHIQIAKLKSLAVSKDTDGNVDLGKNYSKVTPMQKIKSKDEDTKILREMVHSEMEKFMYIVKMIPPNISLKFLRKYIKQLENVMKKTEASTVNVNKIVGYQHFLENETVKNNNITKKNQYKPPVKLNLNNKPEPATSYFDISKLLTWGATGLLVVYLFKQKRFKLLQNFIPVLYFFTER